MADTPSHSPLSHIKMAPAPQKPASEAAKELSLVDYGRVGFLYVMARSGQAEALADALGFPTAPNSTKQTSDGVAMTTAPGEWALIAGAADVDSVFASLRERLAGLGYVSDQSHSRVKFRIAGGNARALLVKGVPIDLHPREFGAGHCAQTGYGDIGVLLHQVDDAPTFDLFCYSGFGETLWNRLQHDGLEYDVACHGA
ncbi:MAG: sarcosine oxidase subunit gamma family protein [Pseudomonadota bacterium]